MTAAYLCRIAATEVEFNYVDWQVSMVALDRVHYLGPPHRTGGPRSCMAPPTYILPDLPWSILLEPILHQAPPGATIVVYTTAMREHVEQALREADRGDLIVCQQDAPPASKWW